MFVYLWYFRTADKLGPVYTKCQDTPPPPGQVGGGYPRWGTPPAGVPPSQVSGAGGYPR